MAYYLFRKAEISNPLENFFVGVSYESFELSSYLLIYFYSVLRIASSATTSLPWIHRVMLWVRSSRTASLGLVLAPNNLVSLQPYLECLFGFLNQCWKRFYLLLFFKKWMERARLGPHNQKQDQDKAEVEPVSSHCLLSGFWILVWILVWTFKGRWLVYIYTHFSLYLNLSHDILARFSGLHCCHKKSPQPIHTVHHAHSEETYDLPVQQICFPRLSYSFC